MGEVWSKTYIVFHVKCRSVLSNSNENCIFSTELQKIFRFQISRKSVQWEPSCPMRTDGRTQVTKLIVDLCNSTNMPKVTTIAEQNLQLWFFIRKFPAPYFGLQTGHWSWSTSWFLNPPDKRKVPWIRSRQVVSHGYYIWFFLQIIPSFYIKKSEQIAMLFKPYPANV